MKKPRILILTTKIIFQWGGSEILVESLKEELCKRDYEVDVVSLPFVWETWQSLVKSAFAARMIDLEQLVSNKPDLVIATRFPAYLINHGNKVIWLFHQHRQVYELCGTEYSDTGFWKEDLNLRQVIQRMDTVAFKESRAVYTISRTVMDRLKTFNNIDSKVLYPIPGNTGEYYNRSPGNYVLSVGRLERIKRVHLLIEAFKLVPREVSCRVIGTGPEESFLKKLTRDLDLEDRVHFEGTISREKCLEAYARSMLVYYGPFREDFGFSSIEGFLSRKPVITLTDSGGILEFVKDGINGYVCDGEPEKIADKISSIYRDPVLAKQLGAAGFKKVEQLNWEYILEKHILRHL